jgi:hypothetical protein
MCQCHKYPALSRKLTEGKKKRKAHGEASEVITTSSYKETRTYMATSHPHPKKKHATEAPSQILANTNSRGNTSSVTERYKDDDADDDGDDENDDDDDALCFYCEERQTGRRMIMSGAFHRMPAVDLRRV